MATGLHVWPKITVSTSGTRQMAITTAGTSIASLPTHGSAIRIEADKGNTGKIFVGDLSVSATTYCAALNAGDSISFEGSAFVLDTIYLDTDTNGSAAQVSTLL